MIRMVLGCILAAFGALGVFELALTPAQPNRAVGMFTAAFFAAVGAVLIYFAYRYFRLRRIIGDMVFSMLRDDGKIHSDVLAARTHTSELRVRQLVMELQRKSLIPYKAEIV